jgi:pyridoxal phosphate enzyme (YggS family)
MQNIDKNLERVTNQIRAAAERYGRDPETIRLLAVSKRKPASDIRIAYQCGQTEFGENFLQEAQGKMQELQDLDICWHFIGAIQSNKTKPIAQSFDWVHCIDRLKIARRLSEQRPAAMPPLNVCIQVNLDHEASKAGIDLEQIPELAAAVAGLPGLRFRGLMSIPAPRRNLDEQRAAFSRLAAALESLQQQGIDCDTLSMGMTQDMEAAIAEGSTLVRIGTAIFGERD